MTNASPVWDLALILSPRSNGSLVRLLTPRLSQFLGCLLSGKPPHMSQVLHKAVQ